MHYGDFFFFFYERVIKRSYDEESVPRLYVCRVSLAKEDDGPESIGTLF